MRDENELSNAADDGADDLLIRRAARELKAPVAFGADFDARVMAAVRAAAAEDAAGRHADVRDVRAPRGARRAWAWVIRPRTLRVSPLAGLAAAAALAFVMVGVSQRSGSGTAAPDARLAERIDTGTHRPAANVAPRAAVQQVQFVLVAPTAKSVALVGDFNDWSAVPLAPVQVGGAWTITVPLAPGRYTYNFVVDGSRVMPDPAAPEAPADDFGTPASVVTVAGAQS
jgi:Carbohydrate-binding module 48 (Isoamylase N-terminal domain)